MRFVQIHHIRHWAKGGETESHNLLSLCRRHHKLHHLGELGISGNADTADGVIFTDARGRALADHPEPKPPTEPPPKPASRYEHPTGERLNPMWTGLGWAHPNALKRRRERTNALGNKLEPDRNNAPPLAS